MANHSILSAEELLSKKDAEICAKYPHAVPGTLMFITSEKKFAVSIKCSVCGKERIVRTSDLFQVNKCVECTKSAKSKKAALSAAAPQVATIEEAEAELIGDLNKI